MRKLIGGLLVAIALTLALPAFAFECPTHMRKIDAKLAQMMTKLSTDKLAKIKALRDEGERLHKAGQHAASVKVLKEAEDQLEQG
ncbi:MAG TPA: hypothetical protein VGC20_16540 [bacterium]|jgi:hypothetical protein